MARKTIKELEAELEAQKQLTAEANEKRASVESDNAILANEKVVLQDTIDASLEYSKELESGDELSAAYIVAGDELDLAAENAQLKELLSRSKSHTNESELRLMAMINSMEEAGGDTGACLTFTPDEYKIHSAAQGRIMGRKPDQKVKCTIEELRAAINSDKTPSWLMEKTGMTPNDLQQLIWRLSKSELRDRAIKLNIGRDFFGKEA